MYYKIAKSFASYIISKNQFWIKNPIQAQSKTFEYLINKHEEVISKFSGEKILKKTTFKDYDFGIVKSIGAWGGDFILVTSKEEKNLEYFKRKGLNTIFKMNDLVYTG